MPAAATGEPAPASLQIRLLGELQVGPANAPLSLPASRKTRALLAYLAATARRQLRSELCSLFWEDAADPRAGLRWSLTQIRRALGAAGSELLRADRDAVELGGERVATDLTRLAALTGKSPGGLARAPAAALADASGLFRGEFLEGLELPSCYAYHEWCMAEREAASRTREQILLALVLAHRDQPAQALVHARALVGHNPLNETGHIALMQSLAALGRGREALAQHAQCCRIFERELGLAPSAALDAARAGLARGPAADVDAVVAGPTQAPSGDHPASGAPLVGRDGDVAQLARCIERAGSRGDPEVLLVTGVPGIGKSRLLDEIGRLIAAAGGRQLRGRAFEAERIRPFGFWIDALRGLRDDDLTPACRQALQPLTRPGAGAMADVDRERLFDAVVDALSGLAASGPVAVLVDDLQWIEPASAALLHHAMRRLSGAPVLFALGGRPGELEDNAAAQGLVAALASSRQLHHIALEPLGDDDARALVAAVAPDGDPGTAVARAQGNPLMLIELARCGDAADATDGLLRTILETRLARLSRAAGELLDWASAFGSAFALDPLLAAHGSDPGTTDTLLSELERHALIRAVGDAGYAFSHDLVRQAAYGRVSQPRRRLMHRSIALALSRDADAQPALWGELAHHAGLGGQPALAARAAVGAGEHGLRLFANREAAGAARRGLRQAAHIADKAERAALEMALLRILVRAGSGTQLAQLRPAAEDIVQAIEAAAAARLHAEVAQGHHLLSVVHQEAGDIDAAQRSTLRAAEAAGQADALGRARQLANSARCLVEIGRDIGRARGLVDEARTLAEAAGQHEIEVRWCLGLLHHRDGELELAQREIDAAIALATAAEDRWRQCKCLAAGAIIELERRRPAAALAHATALEQAAGELGEAADAPLAQALAQLARSMSGDDTAPLGAAIEPLRRADDKSRLACVLNLAAALELEHKRHQAAGALATEAAAAAGAIGETSEAALAQATLARVALARGEPERARELLAVLGPLFDAPQNFSAKAVASAWTARDAVAALARAGAALSRSAD